MLVDKALTSKKACYIKSFPAGSLCSRTCRSCSLHLFRFIFIIGFCEDWTAAVIRWQQATQSKAVEMNIFNRSWSPLYWEKEPKSEPKDEKWKERSIDGEQWDNVSCRVLDLEVTSVQRGDEQKWREENETLKMYALLEREKEEHRRCRQAKEWGKKVKRQNSSKEKKGAMVEVAEKVWHIQCGS